MGLPAVLATMALALLAIPGAAAPFVGGEWELGYQKFILTDINTALHDAQLPTLPDAMLTFGGGGNGPLPIADGNWTIGGFGAGGQAEAVEDGKRSRLALGYGGVRIGNGRPLTDRVSFEAGFGVAFGGATLTVIRNDQMDFRDGLKPGNHSETTYNRFLLALITDAGVSLQLTPLTHLQASVGYFFDTGLGKWRSLSGTVLDNPPSDRFRGLRASLSLSFGPGWGMIESDITK